MLFGKAVSIIFFTCVMYTAYVNVYGLKNDGPAAGRKTMVDNAICQGYNTNTLKSFNGSERKEYPDGCIREGEPRAGSFPYGCSGNDILEPVC